MQIVRSPNEDYALGYRHGSDCEPPNTRSVWNREAYFDGYIDGTQARNERMAGGNGHLIIPEWMTRAQVEAVNKPYGPRDRHEFFTRVQECGIGPDRFAAIKCAAGSSASSRTAHAHINRFSRITQRNTG